MSNDTLHPLTDEYLNKHITYLLKRIPKMRRQGHDLEFDIARKELARAREERVNRRKAVAA